MEGTWLFLNQIYLLSDIIIRRYLQRISEKFNFNYKSLLIANYESSKLEDIRNTTIFISNLLLDDCFINIYKNYQKNSPFCS